MLVNLVVDVDTKTRNKRKTLRKSEKTTNWKYKNAEFPNISYCKWGPIFGRSHARTHAPFSYTTGCNVFPNKREWKIMFDFY